MTAAKRLDIVVPLESERLADAVARALAVETDEAPPRTRLAVERHGAELRLHVESDDARGLRAGANSLLRWADTAIAVARAALPKGP